MTGPFLSIVIPAHNEETRLPATLEKIRSFLAAQPYTAEVVVVENGSSDRTLEIAQAFAADWPTLRVIHSDERGKGRAVRLGMLNATGEYRFFADADLSMPIEEVNRFIPPQIPELDVVNASREAPGARRIGEPSFRHFVGRVFNTFVRVLAVPGLQDTQCGFKCFRGAVAEDVFKRQTIMGWTFDVEILYIARRRGYKIIEVPIAWYYEANSKIRVWSDSIHMLADLLTIRRNGRRGLYDDHAPRA